jgi:hypothetical protein
VKEIPVAQRQSTGSLDPPLSVAILGDAGLPGRQRQSWGKPLTLRWPLPMGNPETILKRLYAEIEK